jgi:hypothetical protein
MMKAKTFTCFSYRYLDTAAQVIDVLNITALLFESVRLPLCWSGCLRHSSFANKNNEASNDNKKRPIHHNPLSITPFYGASTGINEIEIIHFLIVKGFNGSVAIGIRTKGERRR